MIRSIGKRTCDKLALNLALSLGAALGGLARAEAPLGSKPATDATRQVNQRVLGQLDFASRQDFDDALRGQIAPLPGAGVLKSEAGQPVWDMSRYSFITLNAPAPVSVNPSLWRQSQLVNIGGLFKVTDRLYQVRNYDLSNITFIEGDSGVIVMDPLISAENAHAALDLYFAHRPKKPVVAVIYTHSHVDHYGGVKGVVDEAAVQAGKVKIYAPAGFLEEAVSENLFAGNAMSRRATYMYGQLVNPDPLGVVSTGLGMTNSKGTVTLIAPTDYITKTGQEVNIDGLNFVFQMAPDTEAPAEMHFFIRELHALSPAENATHTLHNIYTLRGAKIRDPRAWAATLDETLQLFGDKTDVLFSPHHWPLWGNERIADFLKKQRDMYQYINDQTLRLANLGYKMNDIAEGFVVPDSLAKEWYLRGYYGTISHNVKGTYVKYLGWYDSNPATLHPLPEVEASQRYVEFMGGADAVLSKARGYFARGDYRWVAQVVNHVVMAEPTNKAALDLQADALEQLGYQAESGPWRNEYLTAAQELRHGVKVAPAASSFNADTLSSMSSALIFDYLAVRLNGPKAANRRLGVAFNFTDTQDRIGVLVENGVLHHGPHVSGGDATVSLSRSTLGALLLKKVSVENALTSGAIQVAGNPASLRDFLGLLDDFPFWFPIITPNAVPRTVSH